MTAHCWWLTRCWFPGHDCTRCWVFWLKQRVMVMGSVMLYTHQLQEMNTWQPKQNPPTNVRYANYLFKLLVWPHIFLMVIQEINIFLKFSLICSKMAICFPEVTSDHHLRWYSQRPTKHRSLLPFRKINLDL